MAPVWARREVKKIDLLVVGQADWSTVFVGVLVNACLAPVHVCAHKTSKMVQKSFSDVKTKENTESIAGLRCSDKNCFTCCWSVRLV